MKIGIFGLPESGKTTVFQALSGLKVEAHQKNTEANRAVVKVPDLRIEQLDSFYHPKKKVYTTIEYVDMNASATAKATNSKGLGDTMLGNLRTVDSLALVVRAFHSSEVAHVNGSIDCIRDIQNMVSELIISDFAVVEKNLDKIERGLKADKKQDMLLKKQVLLRCKECLEKEVPLRCITFSASEQEMINSYQFLTQKPLMVIINTGEGQNPNEFLPKAESLFKEIPSTLVTAICGKLEQEISDLPVEEQKEFLKELGIFEPALNRFISESFRLLGLIVFFTVGEDEVRAWTLPMESKVLKAAGTIHSDLERGFIRAEVFTYNDLVNVGGIESKLKDIGKIRLEGRDYIVQDGDILTIRFNVKK